MNTRAKRLKTIRQQYDRFYGRFKSDTNKFMIQHISDKTSDESYDNRLCMIELGNNLRISWNNQAPSLPTTSYDDKTIMEDLMEYVSNRNGIDVEQVDVFLKLIKEEGYDTESMLMDIQWLSGTSNIINTCQNHSRSRKC